MLRITVPILLFACDFPEPPPGENCDERVYAHPSENATDSGTVYIGCDPPDGWLLTSPSEETADTQDTGEAGASS